MPLRGFIDLHQTQRNFVIRCRPAQRLAAKTYLQKTLGTTNGT